MNIKIKYGGTVRGSKKKTGNKNQNQTSKKKKKPGMGGWVTKKAEPNLKKKKKMGPGGYPVTLTSKKRSSKWPWVGTPSAYCVGGVMLYIVMLWIVLAPRVEQTKNAKPIMLVNLCVSVIQPLEPIWLRAGSGLGR